VSTPAQTAFGANCVLAAAEGRRPRLRKRPEICVESSGVSAAMAARELQAEKLRIAHVFRAPLLGPFVHVIYILAITPATLSIQDQQRLLRMSGRPFPLCGRCHCEAIPDSRRIERSEMTPWNSRLISRQTAERQATAPRVVPSEPSRSARSPLIWPDRAFEERPSFDGLWGRPPFPARGEGVAAPQWPIPCPAEGKLAPPKPCEPPPPKLAEAPAGAAKLWAAGPPPKLGTIALAPPCKAGPAPP
jgi:hypothetical protein